ncbi:transmembrane protein 154 isoform 1-T2 [Spinachia spinachia]
MFARGTGNMRGPRMKTPLLLLLLLSTLAGTETETPEEETVDADEFSATPESAFDTTVEPDRGAEESSEISDKEGFGSGSHPPLNESSDPTNATDQASVPEEGEEEEEEEGLSPIIILIPAVLAVVVIGMIVCGIFINRRWNQKARTQELRKEDPYLDGSSTEKVPMPMFEEDVPSVLELEMEELDQWMKKDCDPSEDSKLA